MRKIAMLFVALAVLLWEALPAQAQRVFGSAPDAQTYINFNERSDRPQVSLQETVSRSLNSGGVDRPFNVPQIVGSVRPTGGVGGFGGAAGFGGAVDLGIGGGLAEKPFSYVSQGPTVSPYLNLFREDVGDAAPNYYSLVRPQLEQNQFQQQQLRRSQILYRQLQDLQGRSAYVPTGSQGIIPTGGHIPRFGSYSHFYAMPRRRR